MADGSMTGTTAADGAKPRVLVFVVAYEAEATLRPVLARIPDAVFDRCETEVLVIDDSSRDQTFEVGLQSAWASPHHHRPPQRGQPGLRREPEARLPARPAERFRLRRAAAR
jgi:hypothetical protein